MKNITNNILNECMINKTQSPKCFRHFVYASIISLTACGGGGGGNNTSGEIEQREEVVLNLNLTQTKNFSFSWNDTNDVDHYVLTENTDGSSGFSPVEATISADDQNFNHIVPLYKRTNAQYILQTCYSIDDSDCIDSNTISVNNALIESIGYFKSDRVEDGRFGTAVALSADGTTLAVGAVKDNSGGTGINPSPTATDNPDTGAVYIFTRENEIWNKQAYIKASADTIQSNSNFGASLSLSDDGSTLAVGASAFDIEEANLNFIRDVGAVFVYSRIDTTWQRNAFLNFRDPLHHFGQSLALSGNGSALAVSGTGKDSVHVYFKTGNTWNLQKQIDSPYLSTNMTLFGSSLAFNSSGTLLAIGVSGDDSNALGLDGDQDNTAALNSGAVFTYRSESVLLNNGVNSTSWLQNQYIKASNLVQGFGISLDFNRSGTVLAVATTSAPSVNDPAVNTGAVYMFSTGFFNNFGSNLEQQAIVSAENSDGEADSFDRLSLSGDGNTLIVGADLEDSQSVGIDGDQNNNNASQAGAAYVFTRSGFNNWQQTSYIKASNTDSGDIFGRAVAISGDGNTIAIGATGERSSAIGIGGEQSDNSEILSGAVYLY
jgi:hypothetical protein